VLEDRASASPAQVGYTFLTDGERQELQVTYGELSQRAHAIAAVLQRNTPAGERAVLLYPPGLDFISGLFGCFSAGVIAVPAYPPRTSQPRSTSKLAAILDDARPTIILTHSKLEPMIRQCLADRPVELLCTDEISDAEGGNFQQPGFVTEGLACLQYTSGSTAAPKGVMLTHANLLANSQSICQAFGHTASSRGVIWLPPYHDMGLVGGILQPLYAGFPVVLMAPAAFTQKPLRWLDAVSRYRATTSGGPNFAYELCARTISDQEKAKLDLSSWDVAFNGAEPIDPGTLERFAAAFARCGFKRSAFFPCYGLAESTLLVTGGPKGSGVKTTRKSGRESVSCGAPQPAARLAIVDPETQRPAPPGTDGEIWIAGPSVAAGYWNQPETTASAFAGQINGDPSLHYLRTGDLGRLEGGELFVSGRIKDLVIIAGLKHHPHDVERSVQACHPALRAGAGAAFAVPGDAGERLVIVQELDRAQRQVDSEQVFAAMRQAVAEQHEIQLSSILLLRPGQVPMTSSGKVQRQGCRQRFLSGEFETVARWDAASQTPPQDAEIEASAAVESDASSLEMFLARRLAAAMAIDVAEIEPAEPFARYGLDSVKAASLANELERRVGREVPLTLFWDYPSVSALASHLSSKANA
jgi:acyl-CoA synthetase (AMP-forming)/AMP-acid ligase II/acyl carrier protein